MLDTETTGLSAENGDRVIELGCVELFNRKLTGNDLHIYFNPERESHEDALKVHGLTSDFLRDKPRFGAVAQEVVDYLRGAELIIHNAPFDVGFLNREFERAGLPALREHVTLVTDTLAMAKQIYPGKRNSLDALCDRFGIDRSNRTFHGAKLDAQLLADVYIHLTRGQDALLIDLTTASHDAAAVIAIDLRGFTLPVLTASDAGAGRARRTAARARQGQQWTHAVSAAGRRRRCGIIACFATCGDAFFSSASAGSRRFRAVSSGVEHSIHTAGVGGSKPPPPTRFPTLFFCRCRLWARGFASAACASRARSAYNLV